MPYARIAICLLLLSGARAAAQSAPSVFPLEILRKQCIPFQELKRGNEPDNLRDCRVSEFGEFASLDGETYFYAAYCLIPNYEPDKGTCGDGSFNASYYARRGLAIFVSAPTGAARLRFERVSGDVGALVYPYKPEIVRSKSGTMLYLPIAVDGTGHGNQSEYFLRENGDWTPIEAESWLKDLVRRLPAGRQVWKGVWPNLHTLEAVAGLYRQGDANCCPSGGKAHIQLAIRSKRFVIDSITFEKPE